MSFIEFPTRKARTRRGTVVVVELDPVVSVAGLNDPAVEIAANRVVTGKRIAIVDEPLAGRIDIASHTFYPIGRGLPRDAWPAVAILPASRHPEGRAPVAVSGPLPFGDAYVHTAHTFYGAVSRIYPNAPSNVHLSAVGIAIVFMAEASDYTRLQNEGHQGVEDGDSLDGIDEYLISEPRPMQTPPPTIVDPHFRIWLDVGGVDELADPSTLDAELEQLHEIEAGWRQRRNAEVDTKEQRLCQWRQALTNDAWEEDENGCL